MNVLRRLLATGNIQVAAARRPGANEDCVITFHQQFLEGFDPPAAPEFDAETENVADLFIDYAFG